VSYDILIRNADFAVTMNQQREILSSASVAIHDGKIVAIGKNASIQGDAKKTIDAKRKMVLPGLINSHIHLTQQLARGLADNVLQPAWIHERIYPYEAHLTESDAITSAKLACLELIKTGTTTFAEPGGYHMDAVADVVDKSGLRAVLARSAMDLSTADRQLPGNLRETASEAARQSEEFVQRQHNRADGRIRASFCLRIVRVCSDELCIRIKELANRYGVLIQTHAGSTKPSVDKTRELFGVTDVLRLERLGVLDSNVLAIHMNWLSDEEAALVKERDVKIAHCPTTSPMAGGYGTFVVGRFPELIENGVTVSVGADAAPCSNFLDVVRVMYQTIYFRDIRSNPFMMRPETVLELGTLHGARALLWEDEIGSLEPGKRADLILVDLNTPEMTPLHNPISNFIHAGSGALVDTSIVNGIVLMESRRVLTLDEDEILAEANQAGLAVARRAGLTELAQPQWPIS